MIFLFVALQHLHFLQQRLPFTGDNGRYAQQSLKIIFSVNILQDKIVNVKQETQRQATLHGCRPGLMRTMGTSKGEKVCGEENNILYWADKSSQGKTKIYGTNTMSPVNQLRDSAEVHTVVLHISIVIFQFLALQHLHFSQLKLSFTSDYSRVCKKQSLKTIFSLNILQDKIVNVKTRD